MYPVLIMLGAISSAWAAGLFPRSVQTNVTCSSDFQWADNQAKMNPCLVAAYAQGACNSGSWTVPTLSPDSHYDFNPDACSCSWAVYNLLSACTACQNPSSIQTWASVTSSKNCSGLISDSAFFPPNVPLPNGILFPFWATTDPANWSDGQFNVAQAEEVANENHPDVNPDPPSNKSTPTGAIVGGVVGGIVVLLMGAIAGWIIRRRRMTRSVIAGTARPAIHGRSLSDLSQKSAGSATFTATSGFPPGSPTFSNRAHSIFGSARGSIFSAVSHTPSRIGSPPLSPPHSPPMAAVLPLPENVISPFIVPAESPHRPLNRKTSNDTSIAPVRRDESTPGRRLNPPAYTPSEAGSSQTHLPQGSVSVAPRQARGHGHRPGRGEKGSQDTIASTRSLGVSSNNHGGDRMASAHSRQASADAISTIEEGSNIPIA